MGEVCHVCGGDMDAQEQEILVDRLPTHVNLGDINNWHSHIGWSKVTRDPETGRNTIVIELDEVASGMLGNMVETFELRAVGFAGIKRPVLNKATGELE